MKNHLLAGDKEIYWFFANVHLYEAVSHWDKEVDQVKFVEDSL